MAQGSKDPDGGMCHHRKYYVSGCVGWGKGLDDFKEGPVDRGDHGYLGTWGTSNITFDIDIDCHEY